MSKAMAKSENPSKCKTNATYCFVSRLRQMTLMWEQLIVISNNYLKGRRI